MNGNGGIWMQGGDQFGVLWLVMIAITILAVVIIIRKDKRQEKKGLHMLQASLEKGEITKEEYKELYLKFKDDTCDTCPNIKAYLSEIRRNAYDANNTNK